MPNRRVYDITTGEVRDEQFELTPAQLAAQQQARSQEEAEQADRAVKMAALDDTPANVNSVPALRDELNKVKAMLREVMQ